MAEFVRAQIFGTTFEITSRCANTSTPHTGQRVRQGTTDGRAGTPISNPWAWEPLGSYGKRKGPHPC